MNQADDDVRYPPRMVAEQREDSSDQNDRRPLQAAARDDRHPATMTEAARTAPPSDGPATEPQAGPRRALKFVVTLQPDPDGSYRAVLAAGADGCDPLLRTMIVQDLAAALTELARLAVTAEVHWRVTPRYPATASRATTQPSREVSDRARPSPPVARQPLEGQPQGDSMKDDPSTGVEDTETAAASATTREGQLRLFG